MSIFNRNRSTQAPQPANESHLKDFFNNFNCKYQTDENKEHHLKLFFFDFEGGHYIAIVYEDKPGVEFIFPRFITTNIDNINTLRMIVNRANAVDVLYKFSYNYDEESDEVSADISFFLLTFSLDELKNFLELCFVKQRHFDDAFSSALKDASNSKTSDMELEAKKRLRERFLFNQTTFEKQEFQFRPSTFERLTLGRLIDTLHKAPGFKFTSMQLVKNGKITEYNTHDDIAEFDLSSALITGNKFDATHAVATIQYSRINQPDSETAVWPLMATITFIQDGTDGTSLYYYLKINTNNVLPVDQFFTNDDTHPQFFSMLVAHDIADTKKKMQEFDYMWKDIQIKMRDNQLDDLTEEQRFIIDISSSNAGYYAYWGKRFFRQKRYYDALSLLECAFHIMQDNIYNLSDKEKDTLAEICHFIGICYCKLKLYKQAYFYLEFISDYGKIDYATSFINMLHQANDARIFRHIRQILNEVRAHFNIDSYNPDDEDSDIPEHIVNFVSTLRRINASALLQFHQIDDAENEFKNLLNDPLSQQYAQEHLDIIQSIRDKNAQLHATDNTESHE